MVKDKVEAPLPDQVAVPLPSLRMRLGALLVALSLLGVAFSHTPWLPVGWQAAGRAFTNLVGLEHRWNMFAADPRPTSIDMFALVDFADGSRRLWTIDRNVPGGELRYYRWVKWMQAAVYERPDAQLLGLARWIDHLALGTVEKVTIMGSFQGPGEPGQSQPGAELRVLLEVEGSQIDSAGSDG